jgi:hypothetical protein
VSPLDPLEPGLSAEQRAEVIQVLDAICPLETELLGPTTVENVLDGAEFRRVHGGRHIDLAVSIALVSCVSSLAQLGFKIWDVWRSEKHSSPTETARVEWERWARAALTEHVERHSELVSIVSTRSRLIERVVEAVEQIRSTQSRDDAAR